MERKIHYCHECGAFLELVGAYCKACLDSWLAAAAARHNARDLS
jgi:hypothetical protein